jgi:hypothetical protein
MGAMTRETLTIVAVAFLCSTASASSPLVRRRRKGCDFARRVGRNIPCSEALCPISMLAQGPPS